MTKKLEDLIKIPTEIKDNKKHFYHNTKILLKMYPKVLWKINNELADIYEECSECTTLSLKEFIDILDEDINKSRLEERLKNIIYSNSIVKVIDRAMEILKSYPSNGEIYYELLKHSFMVVNKPGESNLLEQFSMSRSTYFRMKREAINLLGIILWGYELPRIINMI
ncbi:hypothetical protein [Clostridium niameyense]|uniref:hypothetical protein n=1 Tax=Clostridium niameyense TaxID=1622073 RepID=UPI00067E9C9C|nr:hypothetical protein [Clostridium niameyense]